MAMALPLGKLTILVGAGLLGSVLAKEGQMASVSGILSGAFKPLKTDPASSSTKQNNDALLAQVDSIRKQVQSLVPNGPVTIITSGGGGGRCYGVVVLFVVVGYGYVWWKGWKLHDITFATKRSLSDACTAIAQQLEQVYSSIAATKRDLSSRIDRTDCSLNDFSEENGVTQQEVSLLRGEMKTFDVNIQSVREVIESLETRIHKMQGNEEVINTKVKRLVDVAQLIEQRRSQDVLQTLSVPHVLSLEPPISNGSSEIERATSATDLRDIQDISHAVNAVTSNSNISNGNGNDSPLSEGASGSTVGGFFG